MLSTESAQFGQNPELAAPLLTNSRSSLPGSLCFVLLLEYALFSIANYTYLQDRYLEPGQNPFSSLTPESSLQPSEYIMYELCKRN